jgi:MoaA/NifB/PqqE/SkfB family radical SAM enzyme
LKVSFVTNGWNFEKIWPELLRSRDTISHIAFSLDGVTAAEHDGWRGSGSFLRLVRAFSRCYRGKIPFIIKMGIRRDTMTKLESAAMFAARVGAAALNFSHLLPTSSGLDEQSALSFEERTVVEQEIASLARIFRMNIGIDVGYYNLNAEAPCSPLKGSSANIDYQGLLTLCCNLSGFRGAARQEDVAADLNVESFAVAHARLRQIAELQLERRAVALEAFKAAGNQPDLYVGSPCLHCLQSFGKIPWRNGRVSTTESTSRSLPVMTTTSANA